MMYASLFRRCWSRLFCKLLSSFPPSARAHSVRSTTNGSAKTSGADHTVNGYLIFILYSVAVLACASPFSLSEAVPDARPFASVVRFIGSTMYMIIRLFAGE